MRRKGRVLVHDSRRQKAYSAAILSNYLKLLFIYVLIEQPNRPTSTNSQTDPPARTAEQTHQHEQPNRPTSTNSRTDPPARTHKYNTHKGNNSYVTSSVAVFVFIVPRLASIITQYTFPIHTVQYTKKHTDCRNFKM